MPVSEPITLSDPSQVARFEVGVHIQASPPTRWQLFMIRLREQLARPFQWVANKIRGYEAELRRYEPPEPLQPGTLTITGIDRNAGTLTVSSYTQAIPGVSDSDYIFTEDSGD